MGTVHRNISPQPGGVSHDEPLSTSFQLGQNYTAPHLLDRPLTGFFLPTDLDGYARPDTQSSYSWESKVPVSNTAIELETGGFKGQITRPDGSTDAVWETHKETIIDLYWVREKKLPELIHTMRVEHGFVATMKQYKIKFKQWKVEKNIKTCEAEAMLRIQKKRAQENGKDTAFELRKRPVPPEKIDRYAKRRKLSQVNEQAYIESPAPDAPTPSDIFYYTPGHESTCPTSSGDVTPTASPILRPLEMINPSEECLQDRQPTNISKSQCPSISIKSWLFPEARHSPTPPPDTQGNLTSTGSSITDDEYIASHLVHEVSRTHIGEPDTLSQDRDTVIDENLCFQHFSTPPSSMYATPRLVDHDFPQDWPQKQASETNKNSRIRLESNNLVADRAGPNLLRSMENDIDMVFHDHDEKRKVRRHGSTHRESSILENSLPIPSSIHSNSDKYMEDVYNKGHSQSEVVERMPEPVPEVYDDDDAQSVIEIETPVAVIDFALVITDATAYDEALQKEKIKTGGLHAQADIDRHLRFSAKIGDHDTVQTMLRRGADINNRGKSHMTALDLAAYRGHAQVIQTLLDHGAAVKRVHCNMDFRSDGNNVILTYPHPIEIAVYNSHVDAARVLLQSRIYGCDAWSERILRWCVDQNDVELTQIYLGCARPLGRTINGSRNLIYSAAEKDADDMIQTLLKFVPEIDSTRPMLLTRAIRNRDKRACNALLRHGADPTRLLLDSYTHGVRPACGMLDWGKSGVCDHYEVGYSRKNTGFCDRHFLDTLMADHSRNDEAIPDKMHISLLLYAAATCHHQTLDRLIKAGASVDHVNYRGDSALGLAARNTCAKCVTTLLRAGASVDIVNNSGDTALHIAADGLGTQSLTCLLAAGANPDITNNQGDTPLHRAVKNYHTSVLRCLLAAGADPDTVGKQGDTPLHLAVGYYNLGALMFLLEAGANPDIANNIGYTPFQLAVRKGFREGIAKFKARGLGNTVDELY